ncbi:hypothetical protein Tco_0584325 [Tanacetum coccineum]
MFKVFNRYLTTRTYGHDQTKINILQLFHAVINHIHVDYASLLWWDFMNYVFQKKDYIQLEEDYHSIKDDIPLSSGEEEEAKCWRDEFTKKSLKVTIRKKKQITTPIPPPGDDIERDEMAEATHLSLTLHKTTLAAKAKENIAKVQEKLDEEEIERMVEGDDDDESDSSEFANSMFNNYNDDSDTWIEPESHKENPKVVEDDDDVSVIEKKDDEKKDDNAEKADDAEEKDDDDQTDHALVRPQAEGSMETRNEQMQTPIPTPNRPPKKYLSLDKTIFEKLTTIVSKRKRGFTSHKTKILSGSIAGISRRRGQIRTHIKIKFLQQMY